MKKMDDEEFYKLTLEEQWRVFAHDNRLLKTDAQRYKELLKECKKKGIQLGESVDFKLVK